MINLETKRLLLNNINLNDKEDYFINISHDKKVLETFICKYCESMDELDISKYTTRDDVIAVRLKENNKLIGILTLFDVKDGHCEIGYGIGSSYWNNGYATEAVKVYIEYLFSLDNINTIYCSFFEGNIPSKRVMEKNGMIYSHTNVFELTYLDIPRTLIYYKKEKKNSN